MSRKVINVVAGGTSTPTTTIKLDGDMRYGTGSVTGFITNISEQQIESLYTQKTPFCLEVTIMGSNALITIKELQRLEEGATFIGKLEITGSYSVIISGVIKDNELMLVGTVEVIN